jgi:hypothetical protein
MESHEFLAVSGACANGYHGARFENTRLWSSFIKGARQFPTEQVEWMDWVVREKFNGAEQRVVAING